MIELRTLGTLELTSDEGVALDSVLTQPRRVALLCYLALGSPRGFRRRDTLLALFWPEQDAASARHALRQSLYFLRHALGAGAILSRGDDDLAISPDLVWCDAIEFERALHDQRLDAALAMYRGDLLPGFFVSNAPEFEKWLDRERARIRQCAASAAWTLAEEAERSQRAEPAALWAQRAVDLSPLDETVTRRFVRLLDRLGDGAAAVRAYQHFALELEREYELRPSAETRSLLETIRRARTEGGEVAGRPRPASAETEPLPPQPLPTLPVSPTARRASRPRFRAGVATVFLALLGLGAWRLTTRAHATPAPATRERVIVADFTAVGSDSTIGDLVADVLRSELARSQALRVVGSGTIDDGLRLMQRKPGSRLTSEVATELALRQRIRVAIEGDVRGVGQRIVISARIVDAASGDAIFGASESASDSTQILAAIARLSNALRQGAGESLVSIGASDSLYSFTTSSLPALRKHMQGVRALRRGDYTAAAALSADAIALDPGFASAYLTRWAALRNAGAPIGRALPSLMRAYELRSRLDERERYAIEGNYELNARGDLARSIIAYRRHLAALDRLPSREAGWYASLAWAQELSGDLRGAEATLEDARQRHPTGDNQERLVRVLYDLGNDAGARAVLDEALQRFPSHPGLLQARALFLADTGRYDEATAIAVALERSGDLVDGLRLQAELEAIRGRYRDAIGHLRALKAERLAHDDLGGVVEVAAAIARLQRALGDSSGSADASQVPTSGPIESLDVLVRPYLPLALFHAETGHGSHARAWIERYEREFPALLRAPYAWQLHRARAVAWVAEGRSAQALAELRLAASAPPIRTGLFDAPAVPTLDLPELARIHAQLGARDSAIGVYERYLGAHVLDRLGLDAFELGPAEERLGELYAERGDSVRAAASFARVGALWRDADPELLRGLGKSRRRAMAAASQADERARR